MSDSGTVAVPKVRPAALVVRWIERLVAATRVYDPANPVYQQNLQNARAILERALRDGPMRLIVTEAGFVDDDGVYGRSEERDALHARLYLDGIRALELRPGAEDDLAAFAEAFRATFAPGGDGDLLTTLWCASLHSIAFHYVDPAATEAPEQEASEARKSERYTGMDGRAIVQAELAADTPSHSAGEDEKFEATLYFLDDEEIARLNAEIEEDYSADLRRSVAAALLDRLCDPESDRTGEIAIVLREMLGADLSGGDLSLAAELLPDLAATEARQDIPEPALHAIAELRDEASSPDLLRALLERISAGSRAVGAEELAAVVGSLRPSALPTLLHALSSAAPRAVALLQPAVDALARRCERETAALLASPDAGIACAAAGVAARLELREGHDGALRMLASTDPGLRLAALEYLTAVRNTASIARLVELIADPERGVRIAAAEALGRIGYAPAATAFRNRVRDRSFWRVSTREAGAVLDAYVAVAGANSLATLRTLLFEKTFWLRRPPAEIRAAAANALGRIRSDSARRLLEKASRDKDPTVRLVAQRALGAQ